MKNHRTLVGAWNANTGEMPHSVGLPGIAAINQNYVAPEIHVLMRSGAEYTGRFANPCLWRIEGGLSDIILWRHK